MINWWRRYMRRRRRRQALDSLIYGKKGGMPWCASFVECVKEMNK